MIGLVLGCALCFSLGWFVHVRWLKVAQDREFKRLAAEPYETALSPYAAAIREFDRRIKFARDHHMSVKHILAEKEAFVKAELGRCAVLQAASANCPYWTIPADATQFTGNYGEMA